MDFSCEEQDEAVGRWGGWKSEYPSLSVKNVWFVVWLMLEVSLEIEAFVKTRTVPMLA